MRNKVVFGLLLVFFNLRSLSAQVTQQWAVRYSGLSIGENIAVALAVDADGNVYVTGQSMGMGTDFDYVTIKYDADGNQVWLDRYNGTGNGPDKPSAIAVDADGNVYVTGASTGLGTGFDYLTIKYGAAGNRLWVDRRNGAANGDDYPTAMALDAAGNVYVTGYAAGVGTGYDYATLKYDPAGNIIWGRLYDGDAHGDDAPQAIAVDAAGSVYVTGYSWGVQLTMTTPQSNTVRTELHSGFAEGMVRPMALILPQPWLSMLPAMFM